MADSSTIYRQCALQVRIPFFFFFLSCSPTAPPGPSPPHSWGLEITPRHNTPHEGSAGRRDLYLTPHKIHNRDIHYTGGIRTRNPGKRVATGLRLRSRIGCIPSLFVYLLHTTLLRPLNAHDYANLHITQRAYLMFSIIHTHTLVSVLVNIKQSEFVF